MNHAFVPGIHSIRERQKAKRSCNKVVNLYVRIGVHWHYAVGKMRSIGGTSEQR